MILGVPYIYLGYPYTKGYRKEGFSVLNGLREKLNLGVCGAAACLKARGVPRGHGNQALAP